MKVVVCLLNMTVYDASTLWEARIRRDRLPRYRLYFVIQRPQTVGVIHRNL